MHPHVNNGKADYPLISIGEVSLKLANVPSLLFIIAGMGCAVFAYIIAIIHADRLSKISMTYRKVNKMLPFQYRRISTIDPNKGYQSSIKEQFMNIQLAYFASKLFFIVSISLRIVLIHNLM